MATRNHCDGTGVDIPEDTPTTGLFGKQYCDEARIVAEKYLADLDALHTQHAHGFQRALEELRDRYRKELTELPDDV